jgi:Putative peptidoglycan binding domain
MTAALVLPASASAGAPDVAALQVALRIRGTYGGGIDGIFGPETQTAVRRFQRSQGLIVDGDPGPRTRAAFGRFARHRLGTRLLRSGRFGWDVAVLQHLLVRCGFTVGAIDGFFGPRTRTVVVRYQHRASLFVDGVAGAATIGGLRRALGCRELKGAVPPGVTVSGVGIGGLSAHWASIALRSAFAEPYTWLHVGAAGWSIPISSRAPRSPQPSGAPSMRVRARTSRSG